MLALIMNGCSEDFLEIEPKDGVFESTVWSSIQNANLFLNDIYRDMPTGFLTTGYDRFDNWTDNSIATFGWLASNNGIARRDYSPDSSPVASWWSSTYGIIRKCNIAIIQAPTIEGASQEEIDQFIGQAQFLRAYWYSWMVNFFGGVPIITEALDRTSGEDLEYPRSTYEDCIEFIRQDFQDAADALPATWGSGDKGRATEGSALAFKSEIELYAGQWQNSYNTSKEVMALDYSLAPDYGDMFIPIGEVNNEVIFDVDFDGDARAHNLEVFHSPRIDLEMGVAAGWGHTLPTQDLVDCYEFTDGTLGDDPIHADDPYTDRDNRFYETILYDGAPWKGSTIYTRFDPEVQQGSFSNSFDDNHTHQGTLTGYYWRKSLDESIFPSETNFYGKSVNGTNIVLMRFGEVLLNMAEAKNELTGPDAEVYEAINSLRQRGGIPDLIGLDQAQMREKIRNERRVELAFEGKRYFDIMRWGIALDVLDRTVTGMRIEEQTDGSLIYNQVPAFRGEKAFNSPRDYLFPIPITAIDKNSKLVQNPGW